MKYPLRSATKSHWWNASGVFRYVHVFDLRYGIFLVRRSLRTNVYSQHFLGLIVTDGSFVSSTRWNQITRWIFTIRLVTHLSNFVHLIMPLLRITAVSRKSGLSVSAKIRGATFRWFPLQIRDQNSAVFLQMSVVSRLEVWNAVS